MNIDCYKVNSLHLHYILTFVTICFLCVISTQYLKQYNYSADQIFNIISMEFLSPRCRHPSSCPWQQGARRDGCFHRLASTKQKRNKLHITNLFCKQLRDLGMLILTNIIHIFQGVAK